MTLEVDKLEALSELLEVYITEKGLDVATKNNLRLDEDLDIEALTIETVKKL